MDYLSECCDSPPYGSVDLSSSPYGGPSGFCSTCFDNCIFRVAEAQCYSCAVVDTHDDFIWTTIDGGLHLLCWNCADKIHKGDIESC
jgi:hypothetical protein